MAVSRKRLFQVLAFQLRQSPKPPRLRAAQNSLALTQTLGGVVNELGGVVNDLRPRVLRTALLGQALLIIVSRDDSDHRSRAKIP
jgi:hypothetical protein